MIYKKNHRKRKVAILLCIFVLVGTLNIKELYATENDDSDFEEVTDWDSSEEDEPELESEENCQEEQIIEGVENSWRYDNGERIYFDTPQNGRSSFKAWSKVNGYYVNSKGEKIEGAIAKGIDVSEWQGTINWEKVKNTDIDYAIIRCGYGQDFASQDDLFWKRNADECNRLNIPFGTYLYSYADTVEKAIGEANHVLRLVKGYSLTYPIYYDLEESNVRKNVSKSEIAKIAKAFCDTVAAAGYRVAIYSNTDWYTNYLTDSIFNSMEKWVAQYNSICTYKGKYTMWQCTDSGQVDGIEGNVDLNMDFGTVDTQEPKLIEKNGNYYGYSGNVQLFDVQKINGSWYYFDKNNGGAALRGWRNTANNSYYYSEDGKLVRGVKKIGDSWYYFNSNGSMQKGWRTTANNSYYYEEDGKLVRGVKKIGGAWYYFNSNGSMQKGWRTTVKSSYYYREDGKLVIGRKEIDGYYYYFRTNGSMYIGWLDENNCTYYYDELGHMALGEKEIEGYYYAFDNEGKMIKDAWYNGKYYGEDGKHNKK